MNNSTTEQQQQLMLKMRVLATGFPASISTGCGSWQVLCKTIYLLPPCPILCWKFMAPSAVPGIKSVIYVRANICLVL